MDLRVVLTCPRCGERREVHIIGGWDLKNVRHTCRARESAFTDEIKPRGVIEGGDPPGEWESSTTPRVVRSEIGCAP